MATVPRTSTRRPIEYPTSDGKPMAETDLHRRIMFDVIQTLEAWFADDPMAYVSGNLLLFYEEGNRRRHVAPDAFVVRGVRKIPPRKYYLLWEEGRSPDFVVEITSKTTQREDRKKKRDLYRDVLRVNEYFQFDPTEDYLRPSLQGVRLVGGEYREVEPVARRLPSEVLGLHLERSGNFLRLYDPATARWLPTPLEAAEVARNRADVAENRADAAEAEAERLRREVEELRRRLAEGH